MENPMDYARIKIFRHPPTERNPYILMVCLMCSKDDLGTWDRTLRHKGVNTFSIAERDMTSDEIEGERNAWRLRHFRYKDWDGLIRDEWTETADREWCQQLWDLAKIRTPLDELIAQAERRKGTPTITQAQIQFPA